jgi:DNA-binding transcriptional LysR family regulator
MWARLQHPEIRIHPLRSEPRAVIAATNHPLARKRELTVRDVVHETFPGLDSSVAADWAGFWYLDDDRGAPATTTDDRAKTPEEIVAVVASGRAIMTTPAPVAHQYEHPGLVVIPLIDAEPAVLALTWHERNTNPLIAAVVDLARRLSAVGPTAPQHGTAGTTGFAA